MSKFLKGDRVEVNSTTIWSELVGCRGIVESRRRVNECDRSLIWVHLDNGDRKEFFESSLNRVAVPKDHDGKYLPKSPHYQAGGIEVIEAIESWGLNKFSHLANVIKYVARHEKKADPLADLKKAHDYLTREINRREGRNSWVKEW